MIVLDAKSKKQIVNKNIRLNWLRVQQLLGQIELPKHTTLARQQIGTFHVPKKTTPFKNTKNTRRKFFSISHAILVLFLFDTIGRTIKVLLVELDLIGINFFVVDIVVFIVVVVISIEQFGRV